MDWTERCFIVIWGLSYVSLMKASSEDVRTQPEHVIMAEIGGSVTLKCFLLNSKTSTQVTWTKNVEGKSTTLATYSQVSGVRVTEQYKNRVNITTPGLNETAITFYQVSLEDEGSYTCIFNVFPTGAEQGVIRLSLSDQVLFAKYHRVKLGEAIHLKCLLRNPEGVQQVSWQKNGETIATYSYTGTYIAPKYQNMLSLTVESRNVSTINIWKASKSDEGEYKCVFNIFPTGSKIGSTSLQVYSAAARLHTEMLIITTILLFVWLN